MDLSESVGKLCGIASSMRANWFLMRLCRALLNSYCLLAFFFIAASSIAATDDKAIDYFLEALRLQGRNPNVISSGYFVVHAEEFHEQLSEDEIQRQVQSQVKMLTDQLKAASTDAARKAIRNNIEVASKELPKSFRALAKQKAEYIVVFDGNNPPTNAKQELKPVSDQDGINRISQSLLSDTKANCLISFQPEARVATVGVQGFRILPVLQFGRARSDLSLLVTAVLTNGGDPHNIVFNPESVATFKKLWRSIAAEKAFSDLGPRIVSVSEFEGSRVYQIQVGALERPQGTKVADIPPRLLKITVDPGRGYICPLEEVFVDGKLKSRFESSGYFLHERSGVWFPQKHVATIFDTVTGNITEQSTYLIDKEKLKLNEPVDRSLFSITLPAGVGVDDRRGKVAQFYHSTAPVVLRFTEGQLDLSGSPGLMRQNVVTMSGLQQFTAEATKTRTVGLVLTIVAVIFLLALTIRRHTRAV